MSFFIEMVIFFVLVLLVLALLFIIVRISTKTNEKVALLETLVDQQDYQIELLRKVCSALGSDLSKETVVQQPKSEAVTDHNLYTTPYAQAKQNEKIFSPVEQQEENRKIPKDPFLEEVENIKIIAKR
ncbi:YebO family protein [Thorsellia kenyensis]|uniref:YebO family protein n=1 Tax=Thorsellia kenyensis TaxID=1549888 RepID=A0ABV6C9Y3_9GAMM